MTQYKYLGFIIAASGTYSHGIGNLIDKAKRAWFSIYSILTKSKNKNIKVYITLFEYVVKPIMMYGCEIWGVNTREDKAISEIGYDIWERFHLRVCKNILGVHKNTSNIAVLCEMGRYPISHDIHKQMVRYFLRFKDMAEHRLAKNSYEEQRRNSANEKNWVSIIQSFLDKRGLSYIHSTDWGDELNPSCIHRLFL